MWRVSPACRERISRPSNGGDQLRDRTELRAISTALGLRLAALEQIALEKWVPKTLPLMPGIETVLGEISGYGVKGYIVHDAGEAVLVDTAYNADMMLKILEARRLRLLGICLTHGHADHAEGIHQIVSRWPVPIYLGTEDVTLLHWKPSEQQRATPHDGRIIQVGRLAVTCLTTPGHTPGGVCYRLEMPWGPVAFVGDTLFRRLHRLLQSTGAVCDPSRVGSPRRVNVARRLFAVAGTWPWHDSA